MTMETRIAERRARQEERRETDRFYGDRRGGAGLYAEVTRHAEQKTITFAPPERDG